jgi:hypothetical protein
MKTAWYSFGERKTWILLHFKVYEAEFDNAIWFSTDIDYIRQRTQDGKFSHTVICVNGEEYAVTETPEEIFALMEAK